MAVDTISQVTSTDVKALCAETLALKAVVTDLALENRILKTRPGLCPRPAQGQRER
ncbi:hypothetical protein [Roseinatronobacter bogoriensis]|uniref:hypothetical protein n=1 Tax=Roseinatronobacter bogoriensis TaxID=119542 RepID=UPI0014562DDE|nr:MULTISPECIES: hypothetical protein [Rhodobaca]MBB4209731.1 hypothetical protein [Rhodobaca bogoriensis DSM 18756]